MRPIDRVCWLVLNAGRNVVGAFAALNVEHGRPDATARAAARCWAGSPSRLVSDAVLRRELGRLFADRPIAIVDIGCGSGGARRHFVDAGLSGNYLGIDIEDRFDHQAVHDGIASSFLAADAHDAALPHADLVFSFSALEHIPDDQRLIVRLRTLLKPGGAQIHVVPGGWALLAYLWHGWRHYPRGALAQRFATGRTRVIGIGGPAALLVHILMIAVPEILLRVELRHRVPRLYGRLVKWSLAIDGVVPFLPTNYVVIESAERVP